ncbi:hypothetical protein Emag_003522 [Eimeria magna]
MAREASIFDSPFPSAFSRSLTPLVLLVLQAAILLLMAGGQGLFAAAAADPPPSSASGAPLAPQAPTSSSSADAAAAAGPQAGVGSEPAGGSLVKSHAAHAKAAPAKEPVCFHLRNFGFDKGSDEASGKRTEGDGLNSSHDEVVSYEEICLQSNEESLPASYSLAGTGSGEGAVGEIGEVRGVSVSSEAIDDPSSNEASSVSAARQQFYLSSPSGSDWLLQLRQTLDFRRRELLHDPAVLKALAAAALPGWSACPREAVSLSPISGGLSNKLYLVELHAPQQQQQPHKKGCGDHGKGPLLTKALIRVYGHQEGTALFNAKTEQTLFKALGSLGIAPRCLAEFEGGRFEEFWEAAPLTTPDLTDISSFHEVNVPGFNCSAVGSFSHHQTSCAAAEGEGKEETEETRGSPRCSCCCCLCRLELWGRLALEALSVVHQQTSLHAAAKFRRSSSTSSSSSREEDLLLQQTASRLDALQLEGYVKETAWLASMIREAAASDEVYFKALGEALRRERDSHRGRGDKAEAAGGDDPLTDLFWLSGTFPVLSHNDFQENNILQARNTRV